MTKSSKEIGENKSSRSSVSNASIYVQWIEEKYKSGEWSREDVLQFTLNLSNKIYNEETSVERKEELKQRIVKFVKDFNNVRL